MARLVDTHCHTGLHKYEPVETLLYHMETSGVEQAVLIQHMGETDNSYHVECKRRFPGRFAAAMLVPAEDDGTLVRKWAGQGLEGIRFLADARASRPDPLVQWRVAAQLDLVVSVNGNFLAPEFQEALRTFPELRVVIEHLGGVKADAAPPYEEYRRILALAQRPNTYMKLPGFGEFCRLPHPFAEVPPFARMALEAFGPQRLMWGSDFPPVSSREGYEQALRFPLDYFSDLSEEDRGWIFGGTARQVWRLPSDC